MKRKYPLTHRGILSALYYDMIATLTMDNCVFVCGHSYNVYRKLYCGKLWEGRNNRTRAKYMAYASVKDDKLTPGWPSVPTIAPSCIHVIARITCNVEPGREGYKVDWHFDSMFQIDPPIYVHQGVGRFPVYARPDNHLFAAFQALKQCTTLII